VTPGGRSGWLKVKQCSQTINFCDLELNEHIIMCPDMTLPSLGRDIRGLVGKQRNTALETGIGGGHRASDGTSRSPQPLRTMVLQLLLKGHWPSRQWTWQRGVCPSPAPRIVATALSRPTDPDVTQILTPSRAWASCAAAPNPGSYRCPRLSEHLCPGKNATLISIATNNVSQNQQNTWNRVTAD